MVDWTDERVELLRNLWGDGLNAGQIAAEIGGGATRNAVIGKVHRLGLSERDRTAAATRRRRTSPKSVTPSKLPKIAMANPAAPRVPPERALARPAPKNSAICAKPEIQPEILREERGPIAPAPIAAPGEIAIPTTGRVALVDLTAGMCRWPIGDPREPGFGFCGERAAGAAYCGHHAQIAYESARDRRKARTKERVAA